MFFTDLYYAIKIWKRARKPMIPTIGDGEFAYCIYYKCTNCGDVWMRSG